MLADRAVRRIAQKYAVFSGALPRVGFLSAETKSPLMFRAGRRRDAPLCCSDHSATLAAFHSWPEVEAAWCFSFGVAFVPTPPEGVSRQSVHSCSKRAVPGSSWEHAPGGNSNAVGGTR